jgi:RNA methyltransferase, TrmH family
MTKPLKITDITSSTNAHFKRWRSLDSASGIKKYGEFLVSGEKIIREAVDSARAQFTGLITKSTNLADLLMDPWAQELRLPVYALTPELFNELNEANTPGPLLIGKNPELAIIDINSPPKGMELMLALQDPTNLGATLRLAEAFGANVVLLQESAHPYLMKCIRASSGSVFKVPMVRGPSVRDLKAADSMVQLDLEGTDISDFKWPRNVRLLVGTEGPGVPESLRGTKNAIRIPIKRGMDSLNAVSALSIAVYSYRLQNKN